MKCMLVKNFEAGQYAFIPFIRAASKRLFFDGKLLHDGGNQGGGVITDNEVLLAVSRGQHVLQLDVVSTLVLWSITVHIILYILVVYKT